MSSGRGLRPVGRADVIPRTGKAVVGSFKDDLTDLNSQLEVEQIRKEKERQEKDFNQQVQTVRATLAHLVGTFTKEKADAVAEAVKKYQLKAIAHEKELMMLNQENEALKKAAEKTMETDEAKFSFEILQGEHLKEIDILKKAHEKEVKQLNEEKKALKRAVETGEESLQKQQMETDEAKSYLEALQDQHHQEKELLMKSVKEGEQKAMAHEKEMEHLKETLQKKSVEADEAKSSLKALQGQHLKELMEENEVLKKTVEKGEAQRKELEQAKSSLEAIQDQHRQETEALKKALKEERENLQKKMVEAEVLQTYLDSRKKIKETEEQLRQELNDTLHYANATAWNAHNAKVAYATEVDRLQRALKEAEARNQEIKTKQSERRTAIYNENKDLRDKLECKREQLASSEEKNRKLVHSLHLQLAIAERASRAAYASVPSGAPPPARTQSSAATRDPPTTSTPALKRPHTSQSTGAGKGGKRARNDVQKTGLPAKNPPDSSKEKEEATTESQPKRRGRPRKEERRA